MARATKEQLTALFKELDQDGSGRLSQLEVVNAMEKFGMPHDEAVKELEYFLSEQNLDPNDDGQITLEEFIKAYKEA